MTNEQKARLGEEIKRQEYLKERDMLFALAKRQSDMQDTLIMALSVIGMIVAVRFNLRVSMVMFSISLICVLWSFYIGIAAAFRAMDILGEVYMGKPERQNYTSEAVKLANFLSLIAFSIGIFGLGAIL